MKLGERRADATGVTLRLTGEAAAALNSALRSQVFSSGLTVGTADTRPRF
ncbi:hypothetical protein [Streptomyces sp. RKAG290]|nr:hypothetical protein [Streptomyces sp. RKAG290]MCM2410779.1 hypothetical protein [Streptomyces sp. RKAG290]